MGKCGKFPDRDILPQIRICDQVIMAILFAFLLVCLGYSAGREEDLELRLSQLEHRYNYWFPVINPCDNCHKLKTRKVKH